MKIIRIIFYYSILTFLISCQANRKNAPDILGGWNLIHIYKNGNDLLENDKEKKVYNFRNMYIEKLKIDQITIPLDRDEYIYADFILNDSILTLSRSTHPEFDGKYRIILKDTLSPFFDFDIKSLELRNLNRDIQIFALIPVSEYKSPRKINL